MTENDDENLNAWGGDPLCNFLKHFHWKLTQPLNLPWSNYWGLDTFFIARAISGVKVCSEKTPFKSDFLTVRDCIKKAGMWSVNRATPAGSNLLRFKLDLGKLVPGTKRHLLRAGVARLTDHAPTQVRLFWYSHEQWENHFWMGSFQSKLSHQR